MPLAILTESRSTVIRNERERPVREFRAPNQTTARDGPHAGVMHFPNNHFAYHSGGFLGRDRPLLLEPSVVGSVVQVVAATGLMFYDNRRKHPQIRSIVIRVTPWEEQRAGGF